jgi:thiol-disulfide isomerase/thioredoxin
MPRAILTLTLLSALAATVPGRGDKPAPPLALKDLRGRTLRLSDYKGKVVLLNFWATWCAPCRAEMPDLVKWQREYRKLGLQVIGVTHPPQDLSEVRRFVRSLKVNYPIAVGGAETKALFDAGETLPVTVVIDRAGVVRGVIRGIVYPDEFEQVVRPLLE